MVTEQELGVVLRTQAQAAQAGEQQAEEFAVIGGAGASQQFHAALQLFDNLLTAAGAAPIGLPAAVDRPGVPKTQGPAAARHTGAGRPGN